MLYTMFMLAALTILVGLIALKVRIAGIKSGHLSAKYFELMQAQEVPDIVIKTTRCFNNLFEIPVLFYVVCTLSIVLGAESNTAVAVAWLFVLSRYAQAYIHISYNHVRHRMLAFAASVFCVCFLWINLLVQTTL